jgi:tRNA wybutosine-synthesizing protein 2
MKARVIPFNTISASKNEEWRDKSRRIWVRNGMAYIPVKDGYRYDTELQDRKPYTGRGYQRIGNIVVIHGPEPSKTEIEEIDRRTGAAGILWIRSLNGVERIPETVLLAGEAGDVLHREEGISYWIDPSRVMFSQGNREEKKRMAKSVKKGERIADMFAGIGYFTLPVAGAGAYVHAMELNPVACEYLQRNCRENNVADRVTVSCGDCRTSLKGLYDRFIMGHFDALSMLPDALEHAEKGAVLHLHSRGHVPPSPEEITREYGFEASVITRKIKKYSPHQWHFVQDVYLG